jgi:hypothetical protein
MFLDGSPNFKVGAAFSFDPPKLIRAKLMGVIADAAALKAMFEWNGSSGLTSCIECDNLWMKNSRIELASAVTCACCDSPLYEKRSDEDVWESYDTWQAQQLRPDVGTSSCQVLSWETLSCGPPSSI